MAMVYKSEVNFPFPADPGGGAVYSVGSSDDSLLGLWFRIPPGRGCLCLVSVVCCQVEVFESA